MATKKIGGYTAEPGPRPPPPAPMTGSGVASFQVKFKIGEAVQIDGDKDLTGFVTGVIWRGLTEEYEVSWMHSGQSHSAWFPSYRLNSR